MPCINSTNDLGFIARSVLASHLEVLCDLTTDFITIKKTIIVIGPAIFKDCITFENALGATFKLCPDPEMPNDPALAPDVEISLPPTQGTINQILRRTTGTKTEWADPASTDGGTVTFVGGRNGIITDPSLGIITTGFVELAPFGDPQVGVDATKKFDTDIFGRVFNVVDNPDMSTTTTLQDAYDQYDDLAGTVPSILLSSAQKPLIFQDFNSAEENPIVEIRDRHGDIIHQLADDSFRTESLWIFPNHGTGLNPGVVRFYEQHDSVGPIVVGHYVSFMAPATIFPAANIQWTLPDRNVAVATTTDTLLLAKTGNTLFWADGAGTLPGDEGIVSLQSAYNKGHEIGVDTVNQIAMKIFHAAAGIGPTPFFRIGTQEFGTPMMEFRAFDDFNGEVVIDTNVLITGDHSILFGQISPRVGFEAPFSMPAPGPDIIWRLPNTNDATESTVDTLLLAKSGLTLFWVDGNDTTEGLVSLQSAYTKGNTITIFDDKALSIRNDGPGGETDEPFFAIFGEEPSLIPMTSWTTQLGLNPTPRVIQEVALVMQSIVALRSPLLFGAGNGNDALVGFQGPATKGAAPANPIVWQLPNADGAPGTVLTTDGSTTLSWSGGGVPEELQHTAVTGLIDGGVLAVATAGVSTQFTIGDGTGWIVDQHTAILTPQAPVITKATWSALLAQDPLNLGSARRTYVAIRNTLAPPMFAAAIEKSNTPFTFDQARDWIVLGHVNHSEPPVTTLQTVNQSDKHILPNDSLTARDFMNVAGRINVNGNVFAAATNSPSLNILKTAGETFRLGSSYPDILDLPHIWPSGQVSTVSFQYVHRSTGPFAYLVATTTINGDIYDTGAVGTTAVPTDEWTAQRIHIYAGTDTTVGAPVTPQVTIHLGQEAFTTRDLAINSTLFAAPETLPFAVTDGSFRAWLIIKEGTTQLIDNGSPADDVVFIIANKFGDLNGGASSVSTVVNLQEAYVASGSAPHIIVNNAINDPVTFRAGATDPEVLIIQDDSAAVITTLDEIGVDTQFVAVATQAASRAVELTAFDATLTAELRFIDNAAGFTGFKSHPAITENMTMILPVDLPNAPSDHLHVTGSVVGPDIQLAWVAASGGVTLQTAYNATAALVAPNERILLDGTVPFRIEANSTDPMVVFETASLLDDIATWNATGQVIVNQLMFGAETGAVPRAGFAVPAAGTGTAAWALPDSNAASPSPAGTFIMAKDGGTQNLIWLDLTTPTNATELGAVSLQTAYQGGPAVLLNNTFNDIILENGGVIRVMPAQDTGFTANPIFRILNEEATAETTVSMGNFGLEARQMALIPTQAGAATHLRFWDNTAANSIDLVSPGTGDGPTTYTLPADTTPLVATPAGTLLLTSDAAGVWNWIDPGNEVVGDPNNIITLQKAYNGGRAIVPTTTGSGGAGPIRITTDDINVATPYVLEIGDGLLTADTVTGFDDLGVTTRILQAGGGPSTGAVIVNRNDANAAGELRFIEQTAGTNYIGFRAPAGVASNAIWTLPADTGTALYFLRIVSDAGGGFGQLEWADPSSLAGTTLQGAYDNQDTASSNAIVLIDDTHTRPEFTIRNDVANPLSLSGTLLSVENTSANVISRFDSEGIESRRLIMTTVNPAGVGIDMLRASDNTTGSKIRFEAGDGGNAATFRGKNTMTANTDYILPDQLGNAGDVLTMALPSGTETQLSWSAGGAGSGIVSAKRLLNDRLDVHACTEVNVFQTVSAGGTSDDFNTSGGAITWSFPLHGFVVSTSGLYNIQHQLTMQGFIPSSHPKPERITITIVTRELSAMTPVDVGRTATQTQPIFTGGFIARFRLVAATTHFLQANTLIKCIVYHTIDNGAAPGAGDLFVEEFIASSTASFPQLTNIVVTKLS